MKRNVHQSALNYGEISPSMYGRENIEQYRYGLKELKNFVVRPQGGILRREGSRFGVEVPDSTKDHRIIPWIAKSGQYIILLESSAGRQLTIYQESNGVVTERVRQSVQIRHQGNNAFAFGIPVPQNDHIGYEMNMEACPFFTGMGPYQMTSSGGAIPAGLSAATDYWLHVTTQDTTDYFPELLFQDNYPVYVGFATSYQNALDATVVPITTNGTGTITYGPTVGENGYHVDELFLSSAGGIDSIRYWQDDDDLYISCHNGRTVYRLTETVDIVNILVADLDGIRLDRIDLAIRGPLRTGGVSNPAVGGVGGGAVVNFADIDPPTGDMNIVDDRVELTQTSGSNMPVLQSSIGTQFSSFQLPGDLVLGVRTSSAEQWALAMVDLIDYVGMTNPIEARLIQAFETGSASSLDCEVVFMGTTFKNIGLSEGVRAMAALGGRLIVAGGDLPEMVHVSSINDGPLPHFLPLGISILTSGDLASNSRAFSFDIGNDTEQVIRAFYRVGSALFAVTKNAIYQIVASDGFAAVPDDVVADKHTDFGGSDIQPATIEDAAIYVSANKRRLYRTRLAGTNDGYQTDEITIFSDHILESKVLRLAHQPDPYPILWALCECGKVVSFTVNNSQLILGGANHILGGTSVLVKDAFTMQHGEESDEWLTYLLVEREVDGNTVKYIEFIEQKFLNNQAIEDMIYLDCAGIYENATPFTNVPASTFDHLANETVRVFADGVDIGEDTITAGGILTTALAVAATKVVVGYTYESQFTTLPQELEIQNQGQSHGTPRQAKQIVLLLHNSLGGKVGRDGATPTEALDYRDPATLFDGWVEVNVDDDLNRFGSVSVLADGPFGFTVNGITHRIEYGDEGGEGA